MAATYVTKAELRAALGIGSLYSDTILESCCQAAQDLIQKQLWFNEFPVAGAAVTGNIATLVIAAPLAVSASQDVIVTGCGSPYNGTFTVLGTYPWTTGSSSFNWWAVYPYARNSFPNGFSMIQYAVTNADQNYHQVIPYGKIAVTPTTGVNYATEPLINQASLMLAIDIFQARQQSNAGGVSPDFSPSPYRMGSSLLGRVRGLISPYLSPRGMIG